MATNLLSLPLVEITVQVATNESWRDGVAFTTAGFISGYPTSNNVGNGGMTGLSVAPGAYVGNYAVTLTGQTQYRVADPDGYLVGTGTVGIQFQGSGISLMINAGSLPFAAGDGFTITTLPQPIDLTGIRFMMAVRLSSSPLAASVILSGDTADGTLVNGGSSGVLGFAIPAEVMETVATSPTGSDYVFDVLALADNDQRRCIKGTLAVVPGYTLPAD